MRITTLFAVVLSASGHSFGWLDESVYEHISRTVRSTPHLTNVYTLSHQSPFLEQRKEKKPMMFENICDSVREWKNISKAVTSDGSEVTVIQGMFGWAYQWFYTVQCSERAQNKTCQWIDEKRAPRTACRTGYNLVPAIVRVDTIENGQVQSSFDWRMIRVPGQCSCYRIRTIASIKSYFPYATKLSALN